MASDAVPASASSPVPAKSADQAKTTEGKGQPEAPRDSGTNAFKGTKHRVVIDGVSQEVEYDQLIADYQKGSASDKKMKEAAQAKQAVSEVVEGLRTGDAKAWEWLKKTVPKDVFKKVAFDFAYQQMELDALPPEKKKEMELSEWEQRLKAQEEAKSEEHQKHQWTQEVNQAGEYIQKQFDEFVARTGKPLSSEEMFRMSEYTLAYIKKNNSFPNLDNLYGHVSRLHESEAASVLKQKASNTQELLKWMPPEVVKAIKQSLISDSTASQPRRGNADDKAAPAGKRGDPKKVGIDEAFTMLEKRMKRSR